MGVASVIIKEDRSVDWHTFDWMQKWGGSAYQNALDQLKSANILSEDKNNSPVPGAEGLYFTRESDAKEYTEMMKGRVEMLLTCRC